MITGIAEKEIARVWECQLLSGGNLATEEGEPLEIIEPGWLNDDRGPDFKDAVLRFGRGLLRGDIEIHVCSSAWREHRHHLDTMYDRVILHVVMWHDAGTPVRLKSGGKASTLVLRKYANVPLSGWPALAPPGLEDLCPAASTEDRAVLLDRAGEERFLGKASRFAGEMQRGEASQRLYEGVMGALGYSRNKLPFLELARRAPLRALRAIGAGGPDEAGWLLTAAALLGASGLPEAPGQSFLLERALGNRTAESLRGLAASCRSSGDMSPRDWHVLKVRPANSPALRLLAVSCLLSRYRETGWLEGLTCLVREAEMGQRGSRDIEAGLEIRYGEATLLGRERAADIAVNVLLPFTFAWSRSVSEPGLDEKALGLYRIYPRLAVNAVERQMTARLGLRRGLMSSARRQQGLIHIYKTFCSRGECEKCPLRQL